MGSRNGSPKELLSSATRRKLEMWETAAPDAGFRNLRF
jgi:hypothetical protein